MKAQTAVAKCRPGNLSCPFRASEEATPCASRKRAAKTPSHSEQKAAVQAASPKGSCGEGSSASDLEKTFFSQDAPQQTALSAASKAGPLSSRLSVELASLSKEIPRDIRSSVQSRREALEDYETWRRLSRPASQSPPSAEGSLGSGSQELPTAHSAGGDLNETELCCQTSSSLGGVSLALEASSAAPEAEEAFAAAAGLAAALAGEDAFVDGGGEAERMALAEEARAVSAIGQELFFEGGVPDASAAVAGNAGAAFALEGERLGFFEEAFGRRFDDGGEVRLQGRQLVVPRGLLSVCTSATSDCCSTGCFAPPKRERREDELEGSDADAEDGERCTKRRRKRGGGGGLESSEQRDLLAELLLAPLMTADELKAAAPKEDSIFSSAPSTDTTACPSATEVSRRGSDVSAVSSSLKQGVNPAAREGQDKTAAATRRRRASSLSSAASPSGSSAGGGGGRVAGGGISKQRRRRTRRAKNAGVCGVSSPTRSRRVSLPAGQPQELRRSQRCVDRAERAAARTASPESDVNDVSLTAPKLVVWESSGENSSSPRQFRAERQRQPSPAKSPSQRSGVPAEPLSHAAGEPPLERRCSALAFTLRSRRNSKSDAAPPTPARNSAAEAETPANPSSDWRPSGGEDLAVEGSSADEEVGLKAQQPRRQQGPAAGAGGSGGGVKEEGVAAAASQTETGSAVLRSGSSSGLGFYAVQDGGAEEFPVVRGVSRDNTKKRWAVYWKGYRRYFYDRLHRSCAEAYRLAVIFRERATHAALAVAVTGDCRHLEAAGLLHAAPHQQLPSLVPEAASGAGRNKGESGASGLEAGSGEAGGLQHPSQQKAAAVFAATLEAAARAALAKGVTPSGLLLASPGAGGCGESASNNNNNPTNSKGQQALPPRAERMALTLYKEAIGFVLEDLKSNVLPRLLVPQFAGEEGDSEETAATQVAAAGAARRLLEQLLGSLAGLVSSATTTTELHPFLLLISPCVRELKLPRHLTLHQQALLLRSAAALQAQQQLLLARYLGAAVASGEMGRVSPVPAPDLRQAQETQLQQQQESSTSR